jgi:hypothetical protein
VIEQEGFYDMLERCCLGMSERLRTMAVGILGSWRE